MVLIATSDIWCYVALSCGVLTQAFCSSTAFLDFSKIADNINELSVASQLAAA